MLNKMLLAAGATAAGIYVISIIVNVITSLSLLLLHTMSPGDHYRYYFVSIDYTPCKLNFALPYEY